MNNDNKPVDIEKQMCLLRNYVSFRRKEKVRSFLKYVGYFRASRYGKFLLSQSNQLKAKPTHQMLLSVYALDIELRKLLFEYCKYIEIQLRTNISDVVSLMCEDACFYLEQSNYTPSKSEKDVQKKNKNRDFFTRKFFPSLGKQERDIITNSNKYPELSDYRRGGNRNCQKLPCWVYFSYVEFGNICLVYEYLTLGYKKKILDAAYVSRKHSKIDTEQYITWIQAIKNLRNICCHHNMLVGRTSSVVTENALDKSILIKDTDLFSRLYALKKLMPIEKSEILKKELSKILIKSKVDYSLLNILPSDWEARYDKISKL